jgi:hypothetical protein
MDTTQVELEFLPQLRAAARTLPMPRDGHELVITMIQTKYSA